MSLILAALFNILVSLTMTLFSEKVLISNRCISGLMSNLIKKSWTVSTLELMPLYRVTFVNAYLFLLTQSAVKAKSFELSK